MSLTFEKNSLLLGLSGGIAINSAIVAMNTLPGKSLPMMSGVPLFTIGWILIIKSFLENNTRDSKYKYALAASSVGIYCMAMMARMMMDAGKSGTPFKLSTIVFMLCWLVVGVLVGMKQQSDLSSEEVHSCLGLLPPDSHLYFHGINQRRGASSFHGLRAGHAHVHDGVGRS